VHRHSLDHGWRFHLGELPERIWNGAVDDSDWRAVDLPHDWSIELDRDASASPGAAGGFFPAGLGWYQRRLSVPGEGRDAFVLVEFEGVYMNAEVWLDEHFLGRHPYGYTPFAFDLSPHLGDGGEHVLRVLVENAAQPNSRWYSGSGIYRHVWLWVGEPVHVPPHGVVVTTDGDSTVHVRTTIANDAQSDQEVTLQTRVVPPRGRTADSVELVETVPAGVRRDCEQELTVPRPALWSLDHPQLYRVETEVRVGKRVVDSVTTAFGIRSVEIDAAAGLRLNGELIKLRGGCVHHDNGPLGAASFDRAEERKVALLKANGFNAVRCAHNPPAPAFLDACDRLGLLVIDEAFDCWRNGKNVGDYHVSFDDWWRRDLESMVERDRNHPSVIMWSIGNEVVERGLPEGARLARELADHVRTLDPSRPVTAGVNGGHGSWSWAQLDELFETLDVCGYNYAAREYRPDGERVPSRVIYGSESMACDALEHWQAVQKLDHVVGDFVWTALDYLGESGIGRVHFDGEHASHQGAYPWHQANCGDLDLCGFKRPQSFYRDVVWGRGEPLYVAVHAPADREPTVTRWGWPDARPSWTWPGCDGRPLRVDVYAACETVELFLDGESFGTAHPERLVATFEVPYRPGALRAVGSDGAELALRTAGAPARLRLTPDRDTVPRGQRDLVFVTVEVLDRDGLVHPNADQVVMFALEGPGTVKAVGSGDPESDEPYVGDRRRAHRGRCLVVLDSTGERGDIRLRAEADGLAAAETTVRVK
jgi:beta-galactosidase